MKDFKLYFAGLFALLLIYLVAEYNKPAPINWTVSLRYDDKIPFGSFILYNRLNDIYPGAAVIRTNQSAYEAFTDSTRSPGSYMMIAKTVDLNKNDVKALIKYISSGNSVFIAALNWKGYLPDSLKLETGLEFDKKNTALNFVNPALKNSPDFNTDKYTGMQYFKEFDTVRATVISKNQYGHANYISFNFGKGKLLLMANPQLLSNYSLLKQGGAGYAERVLSYLPVSKTLFWDQYQNGDIAVDISPMRVFFSHEPLQWAYYISLASLVLFVLYEIKRRQRVIPIIEPLKNTTVNFASVVSRVYYEQRDNKDLAAKKILYFSEHLRRYFNLKVTSFDNEFTLSFIRKTGIEDAFGHELINHINYLSRQSRVNDHELIVLNKLIEKFYIQTGSYGK
ncbi:DUF4350 domain-containing protein [Mucilaginibacter litoreus]|uniref:DUF4350 domain-containing protein n=1 Tax=Mucilaginibacter litoreus TaxID=1048221 RepID=A0ABW3AU17_9SPHI